MRSRASSGNMRTFPIRPPTPSSTSSSSSNRSSSFNWLVRCRHLSERLIIKSERARAIKHRLAMRAASRQARKRGDQSACVATTPCAGAGLYSPFSFAVSLAVHSTLKIWTLTFLTVEPFIYQNFLVYKSLIWTHEYILGNSFAFARGSLNPS